MVHRGKLSLGCALCRKRRLLCDRGRPSCSQCLRVNQECFGYRDPSALRIYDQTQEVAVKAQTQCIVARKSITVKQPTSTMPLPPSLISIEERAMSYVFTYYVGTTQGPGLLSYLPDLLNTDPSSALQTTIKAVGLASISRIQNLPESKRMTREQYSRALLATNDALKNPALAKSDSTLGAVVLLSMYEMITGQASDMMRSWFYHVQGATRLLELRGIEQLNSRTGLELFTLVRLQNAISGVFFRFSSHNSPRIAALSKVARAKRDENSRPVENFYNILIQLNDLSVEIDAAELKYDFVGSLGSLIGKALHLDADLRLWVLSLGPFWRYSVVNNPRSDLSNYTHCPTYGNRYHVYRNVSIATMWNHYRQTRIVLNEMIRSMSLRLWGSERVPECQQTVFQSVAIMKQMVDDICTSISYYFTSGETSFGSTIRLLWPLFIAANCASTEPATKEWILQTLDVIGSTTGIQQAISMSKLLREGNPLGLIPGT